MSSIVKEMRAKQQPPEHRNFLVILSASTAVVVAAVIGAMVVLVDQSPAKPDAAGPQTASSSVLSRPSGGKVRQDAMSNLSPRL